MQELEPVSSDPTSQTGVLTFLLHDWCVFDVYGVAECLDAVLEEVLQFVYVESVPDHKVDMEP